MIGLPHFASSLSSYYFAMHSPLLKICKDFEFAKTSLVFEFHNLKLYWMVVFKFIPSGLKFKFKHCIPKFLNCCYKIPPDQN